jgi:hypothetical protein
VRSSDRGLAEVSIQRDPRFGSDRCALTPRSPATFLSQEDERGRQICKRDMVSHDVEKDLDDFLGMAAGS